jgi:hypothetical protein
VGGVKSSTAPLRIERSRRRLCLVIEGMEKLWVSQSSRGWRNCGCPSFRLPIPVFGFHMRNCIMPVSMETLGHMKSISHVEGNAYSKPVKPIA